MKNLAILAAIFFAAALAGTARAQERTSWMRGVSVAPEERTGEVTCFFCSVNVRGTVSGDVTTIGGDIMVHGEVTGDAVALGGNVRLEGGATVKQDAVAIGGFATKEPGAHTHEDNPPFSLPWVHLPGQRHVGWRGAVGMLAFYTIAVLLAALLLRLRRLLVMADRVTRRPVAVALLGLAVLAIFLVSLDVTDQLKRYEDIAALILLAAMAIFFIAGTGGIVFAIGELALPLSPARSLAIGTLAIFVLQLIPIAGMIAFLLLVTCAFGCTAWSGFGFRGRSSPKQQLPARGAPS